MIYVVATIDLRPGTRSSFLAEYEKLIPLVRAERGCIEYAPALDVASGIASQLQVREDTVVVVEKWDDLPALLAHTTAPHMNDFRTRVKEYIAQVRLQVLKPV
jgi:quinol monooxygenase YgiN